MRRPTENPPAHEARREVDQKTGGKAIIALGKALHLTIVAEGVETKEQESFLRRNHCDEIQGFPFSKPIAAGEFLAFAAAHNLARLEAASAIASRVGGTVKSSDLAVVSQLDCGEAEITARFSYRPRFWGADQKQLVSMIATG